MYLINTDASIEPFNPGGIIAWGFIVKKGKRTVFKKSGISVKGGEQATNNVGEYHAVIAALLWLLKLPDNEKYPVILKSDSQLIVNQCSGTWGCREEKLVPLYNMVLEAKKRYGKNITFCWIPREKNEEADALSRMAYDQDELANWKKNQIDIIFDGDDISF